MNFFAILTDTLAQPYFHIALWRYIIALAVIMGSFFLKKVFELYVFKGVRKLLARSPLRYDQIIFDGLSHPASAFVLIAGLYVAVMTLGGGGTLPEFITNFVTTVYRVATCVVGVWTAYRLADILSRYIEEVLAPRSDKLDAQFVPLIKKSLRIFVLVIGTLVILQSLGQNIQSLLAGLGIGSLAVALAAQDSLGNFFGSLMLLTDKPFKVGDWIIVGNDINGFVESIGFRSTQVRSWPNTLVTIPNRVLANQTIDNWTRMHKRRVSQTIGVSYETTPEQMELLVKRIDEMLRNDPEVNQEFIMVRFTEFNESSLGIFLYYFSVSTKWAEHLGLKQKVNLNIMRLCKEVGTTIAFPTRTIYFEGDVAKKWAGESVQTQTPSPFQS